MQLEEILNKYGFEIYCISLLVLPVIIVKSIREGFRLYEKYFNKKQEKINDYTQSYFNR